MDTSFAAEDLAFRDEVREFFDSAYDAEIDARLNNPDLSSRPNAPPGVYAM